MAFHDCQIASIFSYKSALQFSTAVVQFVGDSGDPYAWSDQRVILHYDLAFDSRTYQHIAALRRFYLCRTGALNCFRFRDIQDFSSAVDGQATPTGLDQNIVLISGKYYLAKKYDSAVRVISLPVVSSVIVTDGGTAVTVTINPLTGEVTGHTPTGAYKAGFNFDVPVRFDEGGFVPTWVDEGERDEGAVDARFRLTEVLDVLG